MTTSLVPARAALTRAAAIREPKHYVTEEEAARAVELLEQAGRRSRAMFVRFLWLTGARVSEALAVRPRDLDTRIDAVALPTLKGRRKKKEPPPSRVLPLPRSFLAELLYLAAVEHIAPEAPIWRWTRSHAFVVVRDALVAAGVEHEPGEAITGSRGRRRGTGRAHPHALRHGHAIHALRGGVSLDLVARGLGHASVTTTSAYLQATAEDLRAAYNSIFR